MLKLVRLALTAAILTAVAVRLRRRARLPRNEPAPPAAPARARRTGMGVIWAGIAAIVALTLALALLPAGGWQARAAYEESPARDENLATGPEPVAPTVTPSMPPSVPSSMPSPTASETSAPDSGSGLDPGCAPVPRPVTVRPIDPRVKRAVDRQWRRIERWLRTNAPRTYRTLRAPGKARTIAVAEAQMGVDFPDDLRASLLRHNGSRGAAAFGLGLGLGLGVRSGGASHLGVRQIRDAWRRLCASEAGSGRWNGRMIPFLSRQGRGPDATEHFPAYAVVDSTDGAVGWEGQDGLAGRVPSYYTLMRAVADALEQGTALKLGGEPEVRHPTVERGILRWE
ncbi:SMI1/KNR4 family protein [Nonomuraea fuscirosea]|uniref:SMI1/KNR4 family protein n=1 Tax=Nonomuraea fuscirosea TaxID=1291556 RepID=UPI00343A3C0F